MPLQYIKAKKGWRFGKSGKLYTGSEGREKAAAQGRAIKASQSRQIKGNKNQRGYTRHL